MTLEIFSIIFEDAEGNPIQSPAYKSGETVKLRVHMKLLEPMKCRDIQIHLRGLSAVQRDSAGDDPVTSRNKSTENYIKQWTGIYTPQAEGPFAGHHPAGEFFYPLSFQIPATAPSSFEGKSGVIRYYVEARINKPWHRVETVNRTYTVTGNLDLNNEPQGLVGPYCTSDTMILDFWSPILPILCCCCCGHVGVRLSLAKRGFVPGEEVHVTGQLINMTPVDLGNCSLAICQRAWFFSGKFRKTIVDTKLESLKLPAIPTGQSLQLNHRLPVHSVPPSYLRGCDNINVKYYLQLHVKGSCLSAGSKEVCELVVGSVPLRSSPTVVQPVGQQQLGVNTEVASPGQDATASQPTQPVDSSQQPPIDVSSASGSTQD